MRPVGWLRVLQTTPCPGVSIPALSRALTSLACSGEPFHSKVSSSQESTANPATARVCDVSYGNALFPLFLFFFFPTLKTFKIDKAKKELRWEQELLALNNPPVESRS